jgi:hypothetical protein
VETEVQTGVPILSKIPGINRLFTNHSYVKNEFTLITLIEPTTKNLPPAAPYDDISHPVSDSQAARQLQLRVTPASAPASTSAATSPSIVFETRLLEVPASFMDDFRVGWNFEVPFNGPVAASGKKEHTLDGTIIDNWTLTQLLLATQADRHTISTTAPRITLSNRQQGQIDVSDARFYVTPQISADGRYVVLTLSGQSPADPANLPQANTMLSIPDGGTLLLGGLNTNAADKKFTLILLRAAIMKPAGQAPATTPATAASQGTPTTVYTMVSIPEGGTLLIGGQNLLPSTSFAKDLQRERVLTLYVEAKRTADMALQKQQFQLALARAQEALDVIRQNPTLFTDSERTNLRESAQRQLDLVNSQWTAAKSTATPATAPVAAAETPRPPSPSDSQKVATLIAGARRLYEATQFREAADLLRQVTVIDPQDENAQLLLRLVMTKIVERDYGAIRPRAGADASVDTVANLAAREKLEEKLKEIVSDQQGLEKVLNFLRDNMGANIFVNWTALRKSRSIATPSVSQPQGSVLPQSAHHRSLHRQHTQRTTHLHHRRRHHHHLHQRRPLLPKYQTVKVFDVRDLLQPPADNSKTRDQMATDLIDLIKSTIAPDSWREAGGTIGSIRELNGQLIINQTLDNQIAVYDMLQQTRAIRGLTPDTAAATRPATTSAPATTRNSAFFVDKTEYLIPYDDLMVYPDNWPEITRQRGGNAPQDAPLIPPPASASKRPSTSPQTSSRSKKFSTTSATTPAPTSLSIG